jgi:hypothetical protein
VHLIVLDLIALDLISQLQPKLSGSNWGSFMSWLLALLFVGAGVPIFIWAYRRRLDVLTDPWISRENPWHD